MENDVSVEIVDAESSNDISLEIVVPKSNKSPAQPAVEPQQDSKLLDFSLLDVDATPRHSKRVPQPKQFNDSDASGNAFRDESWNEAYCLDTPKTPKTTSTPQIFHDEYEHATPGSPSIEAICYNDSLDRYMPLSEVLQGSSAKMPAKSQTPESGAENTPLVYKPRKVSNPLKKGSPPYKSHKPKYLAFRKDPSDEAEGPDTVSSTPKSPKSQINSPPRKYPVESEVGTPASPYLEAVCSNDSLDMYMPLSMVLQVSPVKTACKTQSPDRPSVSGSEPPKTTKIKASTPQSKGQKAKTNFKPNIYHAGSEDDTSAAPDSEAVSSGDSLVIPTSYHKVLKACPKKTTKKKQSPDRTSGPGRKPPKNTPSKASNPRSKGPKAETNVDLDICHAGSEDDTSASPDLDAVSSNDSLVIRTTYRKILKACPKKTPNKKQSPSKASGSIIKRSVNSYRASDSPNKWPSPLKPHRPKYAPNKVKSPKAGTIFKRRVHHSDSDDDSSASADLDVVGSNDSLDIPTTFPRVLKACPKKTPNNEHLPSRASVSGVERSENPSKASDSSKKVSSPLKPQRPKYVPNNVKSQKARTTFKRRIYDSEDDPPDSCDLEAADSNIFPIFHKVMEASLRNTANKKQSPTRLIGSGSNPQNKVPFPYRSHRLKDLPENVKTLKAKTNSKLRIYDTESEDDTRASLNVETISSNDSLIPTTMHKTLHATRKNTPTKTQSTRRKDRSVNAPSKKRQKFHSAERGSGSRSLKSTPTKNRDPDDQGPSPYKSHRPKYLPKNMKLAKKKRQQREDFLKEVEVFDAQLVKLPALVAGTSKPVNPVLVNDGDLMGTQSPVIVFFHPQNFFATFDELTFDTHFDLNIAELARSVRINPHLAGVKDYRNLTLFLTVTSDRNFSSIMSRHVEDGLIRNSFFLDFGDLKTVCRNFGVTSKSHQLDGTYFELVTDKSPKAWNLSFFFKVVEYSFPSYSKSRLLRLLRFLSCCWFDPMMQQCQSCVSALIRQVSKHLVLRHGAAPDEFVIPLDHQASSWICNRVMVQILSPFPVLRPAAKAMAYMSIKGILQVESEPSTLAHVADLLADVDAVRKKTSVKDVYQLINMCETLVAMAPSPFDRETKTFLEKLADFAENISLRYSYFENLYFMDTVTRLRTLSTIEGF